MDLRHGSSWVRFGLPGVVLGLGLSWGMVGSRGLWAQGYLSPPAERVRPAGSAPASDGSGTIAFTTPVGGQNGNNAAQLLYLIDTRNRAFAIYRVDPANPKGVVKLEAERQYQWDLKLSDYNNQDPDPTAIEASIKANGEQRK